MNDAALLYKNNGNSGLIDLIPLPPGAILDCGCGAGDNARILKIRGWRVIGVTVDPRERDVAQQFCETVYLADLEKGLPSEIKERFDAVLASHVLEHLAKPEFLLTDLRRCLTPGGVLAVALPNIAHYRQRMSFLRGRFDYTDTGQLDRTHLRFYTHRTAIQLLERCGYDVINVIADGSLPWWKTRVLLPHKLLNHVDRWAVSRRPNLLGHQNLFRSLGEGGR